MTLDETHDPNLKSWVESANDPATDFPIQNLPFVSYADPDGLPLAGVAIGDWILELSWASGIDSLDDVMSMPRSERIELRRDISRLLSGRRPADADRMLVSAATRKLLPCAIGDYTDFYASIDHATNVGRMFRPDNTLLPNYKWVPIGYHGRAASIVV